MALQVENDPPCVSGERAVMVVADSHGSPSTQGRLQIGIHGRLRFRTGRRLVPEPAARLAHYSAAIGP